MTAQRSNQTDWNEI